MMRMLSLVTRGGSGVICWGQHARCTATLARLHSAQQIVSAKQQGKRIAYTGSCGTASNRQLRGKMEGEEERTDGVRG
jgi:hypothetical protein